MDNLSNEDCDRKLSMITINTDSGICATNYDPDSVSEVDSIMDVKDSDVNLRDQTELSYRHRVSLDHHEQLTSDTDRFVVGKARHRRSCSLPDILDFENAELLEECLDRANGHMVQYNFQSDTNLVFPSTSGLTSKKTKMQPVPLCSTEHLEKPCYICLKDNEIYCSACVQIHNYHCKENVKHIPEIAPEVRANLCSEATKELSVMKERFDKIKRENEVILDNMMHSRKKFVRSIMACKNKVIDIMDTIEKQALLEMDELFSKQKSQLETNLKSLKAEIKHIESYLKILEDAENDGVNSVVYELQAAMLQIRKDENLIRDIHKTTYDIEVKVETLGPLSELLSCDISKLWTLSKPVSDHCCHPNPCRCDRSYKNKVAVKEKEMSVRLSGWSFDRDKCCITGCEFLPNGKLILCDNGNKKVKLFDRKFKCISAHSLHSLPWDIAVINNEQAVVTIPDRKQLSVLNVGHRISVKKSINLDHHCWGVAYSGHQNCLLVTCWSRDKTEVLILDTNGIELRHIKAIQGQSLHTPWFIDSFCEAMVISDWGTYMLTSTNMTGNSSFNYRKTELVGPLGLTFDPEGTFYVCGRDSNNIHQISEDGSESRILLSESDGIRKPLNICHRVSDDKLIVTSWMSDRLTVFRLQ
ncbi:hypothetical protein ACF0H5_018386 [Mactra antiquata]